MAPPSPFLTIERLIIAIAVALIAFLWTSRVEQNSKLECPTTAPIEVRNQSSAQDECMTKPHSAGWRSWWHPERRVSEDYLLNGAAGVRTPDWNILYHLGGNGPWVEKVDNIIEGGLAPPAACKVEQVHMVCSALFK